jgi:hypothetical protein
MKPRNNKETFPINDETMLKKLYEAERSAPWQKH